MRRRLGLTSSVALLLVAPATTQALPQETQVESVDRTVIHKTPERARNTIDLLVKAGDVKHVRNIDFRVGDSSWILQVHTRMNNEGEYVTSFYDALDNRNPVFTLTYNGNNWENVRETFDISAMSSLVEIMSFGSQGSRPDATELLHAASAAYMDDAERELRYARTRSENERTYQTVFTNPENGTVTHHFPGYKPPIVQNSFGAADLSPEMIVSDSASQLMLLGQRLENQFNLTYMHGSQPIMNVSCTRGRETVITVHRSFFNHYGIRSDDRSGLLQFVDEALEDYTNRHREELLANASGGGR